MVNFKGVCSLVEYRKGESDIRIVKNIDEPQPFENEIEQPKQSKAASASKTEETKTEASDDQKLAAMQKSEFHNNRGKQFIEQAKKAFEMEKQMYPNHPNEKGFADMISGMEAMMKKSEEENQMRRQDYDAGRGWNHYSAATDMQNVFDMFSRK